MLIGVVTLLLAAIVHVAYFLTLAPAEVRENVEGNRTRWLLKIAT